MIMIYFSHFVWTFRFDLTQPYSAEIWNRTTGYESKGKKQKIGTE